MCKVFYLTPFVITACLAASSDNNTLIINRLDQLPLTQSLNTKKATVLCSVETNQAFLEPPKSLKKIITDSESHMFGVADQSDSGPMKLSFGKETVLAASNFQPTQPIKSSEEQGGSQAVSSQVDLTAATKQGFLIHNMIVKLHRDPVLLDHNEEDFLQCKEPLEQFAAYGGSFSWINTSSLPGTAIHNPSLIEYQGKRYMTFRVQGHKNVTAWYAETMFAEITKNFEITSFYPLVCDSSPKAHEDARLTVFKDKLYASYVSDVSYRHGFYQTCMEIGCFSPGDQIVSPMRPDINNNLDEDCLQKNWLFFEKDDRLVAIYSLDPMTVYDVTNNVLFPAKIAERPKVINDWEFGQVRASTTPILIEELNKYLTFFHSHRHTLDGIREYFLGALLFDTDFNITHYSKVPLFLSTPHLKRLLGANTILPYGCIREDQLVTLSLGVNDKAAAIAKLPLDRIIAALSPVTVLDVDLDQTFSNYLHKLPKTPYFYDHHVRYLKTMDFLEKVLPEKKFNGLKMLELGSASPLLDYAKKQGAKVTEYTSELRGKIDLPEKEYDVILMLEVFQKLKDIESESHNSTWCHTGTRNVLQQIKRLLKPSGLLVLTTPNASSLTVLANFLLKKPAYNYSPHPREYTREEVVNIVTQEGFKMRRAHVTDVWNLPNGFTHETLMHLIGSAGMDTSERGDDMMFVFQVLSETAADKDALMPVASQVIKPATGVSFDASHAGKTEMPYKELPGMRAYNLCIYQMMKDMDSAFKQQDIPYFARAGTLLGAIRHGGMIPWDDDIDLAITSEHQEDIWKVLKVLESSGYKIYENKDWWKGWKVERWFDRPNVSGQEMLPFCDIFLMEKREDQYIFPTGCPAYSMTEEEIYPLRSHKYGILEISIPNKFLDLLTKQFGSTWNTEMKKYNHIFGLHKDGATLEKMMPDDYLPAGPFGPLEDRIKFE